MRKPHKKSKLDQECDDALDAIFDERNANPEACIDFELRCLRIEQIRNGVYDGWYEKLLNPTES